MLQEKEQMYAQVLFNVYLSTRLKIQEIQRRNVLNDCKISPRIKFSIE